MAYRTPLAISLLVAAFTALPVWAHVEAHGKKSGKPAAINPEEKAFGKQGETIRFIVKNSGKVMHEFVLGNMAELKEHAELMKKFPNMEHDEPYMAHVAPGKTETVIWQFTKAGEFHFGCLLPGHFEASMVGNVTVK